MSGDRLEFENPIEDAISRLRFSPESNNLLIASWDSYLRLYNVSKVRDFWGNSTKNLKGTSFAGPTMEDGHISSWWMVDLGEDHQLMCNYNTFRQDGSRAFSRSWKFQGSMDGKTWTDLRVHEDDQTMCKAGQFASWPITAANALLPFRFFRLVLTGLTTDTSTPSNFCICYLELYGYFR